MMIKSIFITIAKSSSHDGRKIAPSFTKLMHLPWLTAIISWLEMILNVSFVRFLTSQPRRRGAYNTIFRLSKQIAKTQKICIHSNHEHLVPDSTAWNTLEIAHKLKWAIYSLFFIPPFPTSSMSGSVQSQADNMK